MQVGGIPDEMYKSAPPKYAVFEEKETLLSDIESELLGPDKRSSHRPPPLEAAQLENEMLSSDRDNGWLIISAPPVEPLIPPLPEETVPAVLSLNAMFESTAVVTESKEELPPPSVAIERTDSEFVNVTFFDSENETSPPIPPAKFPEKCKQTEETL